MNPESTQASSALIHTSFVSPTPRGRGIAGILALQFSKPCLKTRTVEQHLLKTLAQCPRPGVDTI